MPETFGGESGTAASSPRSRQPQRLVDSMVWAVAVVVAVGVAALLTQIGSWGLWIGVILALVVLGGTACLLGMVWRRTAPAIIVCVAGFAAMLFAGPAAYEQYMRVFGEPLSALVVQVREPGQHTGLNSRRCHVIDETGASHHLDQRQNCFDHIGEQELVTIYQDPRGVLPPRLDDTGEDRGAVRSATVVVAVSLLVLTGAVVVYAGLRRRPAPGSDVRDDDGSDDYGSDDDGLLDTKPADPSAATRVLWLERRSQRTGGRVSGPPLQSTGADDAIWEVRGSNADVLVPEHVDITVVAYPDWQIPDDTAAPDNTAASGSSAGSLVLWADANRRDVFARVNIEPAPSRRATRYAVTDAAGGSLAVVTYRRAAPLSVRRPRWIIELAGRPPVVGYQGRLMSRPIRWLTAPLLVGGFVLSLIVLQPTVPERLPPHVQWRDRGEVVLAHRVDRQLDQAGKLHIDRPWWDLRVAAAVATLIRRHDARKQYRWDPPA